MLWRSSSSRDDEPTTTAQHEQTHRSHLNAAASQSSLAADAPSQSSPTREVIKRPPFLGLGATLFFVAFTGAALYGFRAAKKADLNEAREALAAASTAHAGTAGRGVGANHARLQSPSALSSSGKNAPRATTSPSRGLDWGSAGTSAPSVLSKSGSAAASLPARYAVPLPRMKDGKPIFDEPPAVTAIKAFGAATAIVAVTSVVVVEVGRRVLGIEDVYDLTDRLHGFIPKTFALPEAVGNYLRPRLAGLFPQTEEDRKDPLASIDQYEAAPADEAAPSKPSSSSWFTGLFSQEQRHHDAQHQPQARDPEDVFNDIEQATTMKEKLKLLDAQLRGERAIEDAQREAMRSKREASKGR
ncbi:hypothetical protein BDZ90DRAFT_5192 [Jaminaea rosea]|uniref:Transmembrane protein n=1 Tax=Jaminaea rosea TaxID=1569628 RepID=A0A316UXT7_9BASI|nr:hypothetical protein BDZ90DRAFT_5192 [Jaminaea rosea]PWN30120.1 hypothetical protein BDZ90DRAFT_5192 [Jaminaea rosea]